MESPETQHAAPRTRWQVGNNQNFVTHLTVLFEGPPSSSPNPDLGEAMKAAQNAAITSNERAFPVFAKKLASRETKEFVSTARKLAAWLSSEKAYYPGARPKIVELLEIALAAFKDTFVHHSAVAEFAQLLRQLIQAVLPFLHLFLEVELHSRLQRVIVETEQSLSGAFTDTTQGNAPPQGTVTADFIATSTPSPLVVSPVNVPSQPSVHVVPDPQRSMSHIQSSSSDVVWAVPGRSVQVDVTQAALTQTDANPSLVSSATNAPQQLGENPSPTLPSKPQPKRARVAQLSEELIARDLDWFKFNRTSTTLNEDHGVSSSRAEESSPVLASDTTHVLGRPTFPKETARMVPHRRLPRRISFDAAGKVEPDVSVLPLASKSSAEGRRSLGVENDFAQNANEQQPSREWREPDARSAAVPAAPDTKEASLHKPPSPLSDPLVKPEILWTDPQSLLPKTPLLNGEPATSHHPSTPLPDTTSDRAKSMDISVEVSEKVASEPPSKLESAPPVSPPPLQLQSPVLPPTVGAWEPSLNLNFNIPRMSPPSSAIEGNRRRFDDDVTVIHATQGTPFTHTHTIDISLNESIFAKITKWINRKSYSSEAPHGVCISLGCYRLPEFSDKIKTSSGKPDIDALTSQISCSWPHSNRLSLRVHRGTRRAIITLSPPLFLTPDQCVDISSLMKLGGNTLEIRQQGDLSDYLVVLHAHRPTQAQLAALDVVKIADERWKLFLGALSARVVLGEVLDTGPVGVGVS